MLGGWTVCVWAFTQLWNNIYDILSHHYYVVLGYAFVAGMSSFTVTARMPEILSTVLQILLCQAPNFMDFLLLVYLCKVIFVCL